MLGFGWLASRQVQEALNTGRLEEAHRLLSQPSLQEHKKHGDLLRRLARAYVERGERHLQRDEPEAAWQDLLRAEQLQVSEKDTDKLRQALTRLGLAQVRALLQAGEPRRASEVIGQLRDWLVRHQELQLLEDATKDWLTAEEMAEHGEFGQAIQSVERMQRMLLGPSAPLEKFRQSLDQRLARFAPLLGRLHEAAEHSRWRDAVEVSEQILALAPQHAEARKARTRAWRAIEPVTVAMRPPIDDRPTTPPAPKSEVPERFCLWIDGVGGYLVCPGNHITLGQASPDGHADIALVADVSRLHATLRRVGEGDYLLEGSRPVLVNGEPTTQKVLRSGDRITLGVSCQIQFHKPVPVSTSARLDLVSGHRLLLGADGILLMGDTLVLGPETQSHVQVLDLRQPVILFRGKEGLGVRHTGNLYVDGQRAEERAALAANARVHGDDFAFAIEPVTA